MIALVLDALVVAAAVADLVTTERALRRPGLRELNPLMRTPARRVGMKAAATCVVILTAHALAAESPLVGHGARILAAGAWGVIAAHNARKARA